MREKEKEREKREFFVSRLSSFSFSSSFSSASIIRMVFGGYDETTRNMRDSISAWISPVIYPSESFFFIIHRFNEQSQQSMRSCNDAMVDR